MLVAGAGAAVGDGPVGDGPVGDGPVGGGAGEAPGDVPSPLDLPDPLDATPPDIGAGAPAEEPSGGAELASASPGATTVVQAADPVASVADPGVVGPIDVGTALWVANEPEPPHPLNRTTPATAHTVRTFIMLLRSVRTVAPSVPLVGIASAIRTL
ncbi:MAG: hypothetical protein NVS3B21_12440 [Acidimicrobiales bacterium]